MTDIGNWELAQPESRAARRVRLAVVAVAVCVTIGFVAILVTQQPRHCKWDTRAGPEGQSYGRDPDQDCKFVDDDGNVLPGQ